MYINKVHIENFRNFKSIDIELNKYTTIIGENDAGKSNLIDALKLVLNNNTIKYYSKNLGIKDINAQSINEFLKIINNKQSDIEEDIKNKRDMGYITEKIPRVIVRINFTEANDEYQKALLNDWLNEDENGICYELEYIFQPRNDIEFIKSNIEMAQIGSEYSFPVELYEYNIISTNNNRNIRNDKSKNFNISFINAERDNFSENEKQTSYKFISNLLEKNLNKDDKYKISQFYNEFFDSIKELESFKSVFNTDKDEFRNIKEIIETINLVPNLPNIKNIFSNINIGYGEEFLYQKGLGTRNLILLILLFTNYISENRQFNLMCIEEPEAHMCVNNFNIAIDFISKSLRTKNDFMQTIITTHNPTAINKLKFENVVLIKNDKSINFKNVDKKLKDYLSKRPNFDILKILFAKRVILVEGISEEILINTFLQKDTGKLYDVEVISIGQKGFKTFLDIWKLVNEDTDKKIGIVRDFDNEPKAKEEHEVYDTENKNIFVRTTEGYTLEDDIINTGNNREILSQYFESEPLEYMKGHKAQAMLDLCQEIIEGNIDIELPKHIREVIECVTKDVNCKLQEQERGKHMN